VELRGVESSTSRDATTYIAIADVRIENPKG
jgi:hypothetical protein